VHLARAFLVVRGVRAERIEIEKAAPALLNSGGGGEGQCNAVAEFLLLLPPPGR
jgi:hypothetical protein